LGVIGVKKFALLTKKGKVIRNIKKERILEEIKREIKNIDKTP